MRSITYLGSIVSSLAIALASTSAAAPAKPVEPGGVRTEAYAGSVDGTLIVHEGFASGKAKPRRVFVLLPPTYAEQPDRHYPALYSLDAQDLFDGALASGGEEWTLDEILARRPAGVPEMLVVGIAASADAVHEHAPPGSEPHARGDSLLAVLTDEIRPFIESTYRVRAERESRLLLGLGGSALFALYAAWQRADLFAGAIAVDCPDVDSQSAAWSATPPRGGRPWLWFEQRASEKPRASSTSFVAALQAHADVQVVVTGPENNRTLRLLSALRAWR